MTGMEHAIEQAASAIDKSMQSAEWRWAEDPDDAPTFLARALAAAGLLAPAPLREEWAVEGVFDSGGDWIADCEFATRLGAEDFLNSNEWARRDGGHVSRRYYTDWLPVDRAEGESWYDAEPDEMPDAGWEPIEPVNRAEGDGSADQ